MPGCPWGRTSSQLLSAPLSTAQRSQTLLPFLLSLHVFPPQQFKQMWARPPQNLKQSWKEPSGSRLEGSQPPPWSLETADGSQATNVRLSCTHKAEEATDRTPRCLQIGSIHSFVCSVIRSADIVWHSKLFRPTKSLRMHVEQDT